MLFKYGDIIVEQDCSPAFGIILSCGRVSFDVVWIGGSTSRYRHATGRLVRLATEREIDSEPNTMEHLRRQVAEAREERRTGARIKRGQVWPSR